MINKIKLQDFLFLFTSNNSDPRARLYFSTDNVTWPQKLRHSCISIQELYCEIRKYDDAILSINIEEIPLKFSTQIDDKVVLVFSCQEGYTLSDNFSKDIKGALVVGEIFLDVWVV